MTKAEFIEMMNNSLWEVDRFGHYKKMILRMNGVNQLARLKVQKTSVRYEVKYPEGWFPVVTDYFKNIVIVNDFIKIKNRCVRITSKTDQELLGK